MSREKKTNWIRPLTLAALGFGVGAIVGGGKLVRVYDWETEWNFDAPLSTVYKVLTMPEEQDKWWPSMQVYRVTPLEGIPDGRTIEYRVQQAQDGWKKVQLGITTIDEVARTTAGDVVTVVEQTVNGGLEA